MGWKREGRFKPRSDVSTRKKTGDRIERCVKKTLNLEKRSRIRRGTLQNRRRGSQRVCPYRQRRSHQPVRGLGAGDVGRGLQSLQQNRRLLLEHHQDFPADIRVMKGLLIQLSDIDHILHALLLAERLYQILKRSTLALSGVCRTRVNEV
jgi:hypothetical protein